MAGIHHLIRVTAGIDSTFEALTTNTGIARWFTSTECSSWAVGSSVVWFTDTVMDISEFIEFEKIAYRVVSGSGWADTEIVFTLESVGNDLTLIRFDHIKWEEVTDHFRDCSVSWAYFLESLKQYLETGVGTPEA